MQDLKQQAQEIVEYWSSQPHFTRHTDPTKKSYSMAMWCLKTLFEGRQGEKMPFDDDFASDNAITNTELNHKFTPEEIIAAIDKYAYMCSPEFVADKSKWSRSLDYFLYNPTTKRSFFFTLTGDRDIPGAPLKMLEPKAVYYYHHFFWYGKGMDASSQNQLIRNINYITRQQWAFEEKMGQHCYHHELKGFGFYRHHLKYIELNYQDREDFRIDHLGAMTFQGFGPWLLDMFDIVLNPSNASIEKAKLKYIEDTEKIRIANEEEAQRQAEREYWLKNRVHPRPTCIRSVSAEEGHMEPMVKSESLSENSLK